MFFVRGGGEDLTHRFTIGLGTFWVFNYSVLFNFFFFFFCIHCIWWGRDEKKFDEETRKKEVAANLSLIYRIRVEKKLDLTQIHFHAKVARND